jgi:hypothetical protein
MSSHKTMTYHAPIFHGPNGRLRYVQISLPYIAAIADEPHHQPPAPSHPNNQPPRMTDAYVRRALGRDRKQAARALDKVGYEHVLRRIRTQGF